MLCCDEEWSEVYGDILIEDGYITRLGDATDIAVDQTIEAQGLVVLPGFVQTHTHLCQTLFRNLAEDLPLLEWLQRRIWPFEAAHDFESLKASARLGLAEMLLGGNTTALDMGTVNHTDAVFEAAEESGMRVISGKAIMDATGSRIPEPLQETTDEALRESVRLLEKWHNEADGRLQYAFAPRFALSCTRGLFEELAHLARTKNIIVHTHASENRDEVKAVRKQTGMANIEYFQHLDLTEAPLCLAHCIWLEETEWNILAETNTRVLHCPSANMKLGSGIADVPRMLKLGVPVGLGADGAPCNNNMDMLTEMRHAALIQRPGKGAGAMTAEQVLRMATIGGARVLGLDQEVGSIEVGKRADLVVWDLNKVHSMPDRDIAASIVFSGRPEDVKMVMVEGRIIVEEGRLLTMDEQTVVQDARRQLPRLLERAGSLA